MQTVKIIRYSFCKLFKKKVSFNETSQVKGKFKDQYKQNIMNPFLYKKFELLIQKCHPKNQKFMNNLANAKQFDPNQKKLNDKVVSMIDYSTKKSFSTFQWAVATILLRNCLNLSIRSLKFRAMNMFLYYSDSEGKTFQKYSNIDREQDTEIKQIELAELEPELLQFVFIEISKQFIDTMNKEAQKNKKNKYKIRLVNLINEFTPRIFGISAIKQMLFLLSNLKEHNTMITKFRISKATGLLSHKIKQLINMNPELKQNLQSFTDTPRTRFSAQNFVTLINSFQYCQHQSMEDYRYFLNILASPNFFHPQTSPQVRAKILSRTLFNSRDFLDQNGNHPVMDLFKNLFKNDESFRNAYINSKAKSIQILFHQLMTAKFYKHYKQIPTQIIDDCIVMTQIGEIPQLDEFEKYLIGQYQQGLIGSRKTIKLFLQAFYPQYLDPGKKIKQFEYKNQHSSYMDNELGGKLGLVFKNLNIKFDRQVDLMGRSVDFLLQNKIIIECDGDRHIDFKRIDVEDSTAYRNLTYMYNGYKLIVISLHEFNNARDLKSLAQLVLKKMNIMNKYNALLVQ